MKVNRYLQIVLSSAAVLDGQQGSMRNARQAVQANAARARQRQKAEQALCSAQLGRNGGDVWGVST